MKRHRIVPFLALLFLYCSSCGAQDDFFYSSADGSGSRATDDDDFGSAEPTVSAETAVIPDTDDEDMLTTRRTTYRPSSTGATDDGSGWSGDDELDVDGTSYHMTSSTTKLVAPVRTSSTTDPGIDIDTSPIEEVTTTPLPDGPCTAKHHRSPEDYAEICDNDGYFREIQCPRKCKCYNRNTGERDTTRKFDTHIRKCVRKPVIEVGGKDNTENEEDDDKYNIENGKTDPPSRGDGNMLTDNPGLFAGIIGGAVVGLLLLILLVMFIVYRMRKKDEGSYKVDNSKKPPTHPYKRCPQEFYA